MNKITRKAKQQFKVGLSPPKKNFVLFASLKTL